MRGAAAAVGGRTRGSASLPLGGTRRLVFVAGLGAWLALAGAGWGRESVFDEGAAASDREAAPPESPGKPSVTVDTGRLKGLLPGVMPEWDFVPAIRLRLDLDGAAGAAPMDTLRTLNQRVGAVEVETPVRGVWVGMEGDSDPEKPVRATFSVQREF